MNPASARSESAPAGAALTQAQRDVVVAVLDRLHALPGALLPILHSIQDQLRHVPPAAVPLIANALNLSRAEVHGVISFYHHFRSQPPGRHVLQLCRAEACQAVGARELERRLAEPCQPGRDRGDTPAALTVEPVYCLGNCAAGPTLMLDGRLHGRVTPAKLERLLDGLSDAGEGHAT